MESHSIKYFVKEIFGNAPSLIKQSFSIDTIKNMNSAFNLYTSTNKNLLEVQQQNINKILTSFLCTKVGSKYNINLNNDPYDELLKISITDKKTYIGKNGDFLHKDWKRMNCMEIKTSGSSGEPFKFVRSKEDLRNTNSNYLRQFVLFGYKFFDPIIYLRTYTPKAGQKLYFHEKYNNIHYLSAYHISLENFQLYSRIINNEAKFLCAYPSSIYIYSLIAEKNKQVHGEMKAIFLSSEMLMPNWIEPIQNTFPNAKIIDHYATAEATVALNFCRDCNGYHIEEDYAYMELVPTNNENIYEIVGTGFFNNAFPMLRYNTHDRFLLEGKSASKCIIASSVLVGKIIGRSSDILFSDGKYLPGVNFYTLFYNYSTIIRQFQIIQYEVNKLELKLVLNREMVKNVAELVKKVELDLRLRVGNNMLIEFNIVDSIERNMLTGKIQPIISKISLN